MDSNQEISRLKQQLEEVIEKNKQLEEQLHKYQHVKGERDNLYYKTYIGPELVSASIDGDDLTALIKELYGERCNWCETLYTFRSLHHSEYIGKLLRIEFRPRNPNVPEWTTIIVDTLDTVINPPLFMPCPIV